MRHAPRSAGDPFLRGSALFLLALQVVLASPTAHAQVTQPVLQGDLRAALDHYDHGRYAQTRQILDRLIAGEVVTPEILFYRGLVEPEAETAAEQYFDAIIRRYPSSIYADRARYQIAQFRYATGHYVTARDLFGQIVRRQRETSLGQSARYWEGMTWMHAQSSDMDMRSGLRILRSVADQASDPQVVGKALVSCGEVSLLLAAPDSAISYGRKVLDAPYLADFHPRAMAFTARAWEQLGDKEIARPLYIALARSFPDSWEGREAQDWLDHQREVAAQARLDSLRTGVDAGVGVVSGTGEWTIQVGAFTEFANASRVMGDLVSRGYQAWSKTKRVEDALFVAVYVGRFATRTEATAVGQQMKDDGIITGFTIVQNP